MPTYGLDLSGVSANSLVAPRTATPRTNTARMAQGSSITAPTSTPRASTGTSSPSTSLMSSYAPGLSPLPEGFSLGQGPPPLQTPGNNLTNPGYTEQGLEHVQNRLLNDPYADQIQDQYQQTQTPSGGEEFLNQNLGTLQGPGQGDQYWNQVQGQFQDPFAGEQFARLATQQMAPQGAAGAFFDQAMGQYDQFTGFQGAGNTQGQYGANAAFGPMQGAEFYDQVSGSYDDVGRYTDPNLAAGQYGQTQQAFGDLPIAEFDPFYDRARQLATQDYNRQAAGRGVYGSSEALSGVGNIITDIEAQRANRAFDAEMQRAVEQRNRQALLGEQARMGDLSSLAGFGANLAGLEAFGDLADMAGQQTLGQQTMLGNQANMADNQANTAQELNLRGVDTYGDLSGQADRAETDRFNARTGAMRDADRTELDRMGLGADIAFRGDDSARSDYIAESNAAQGAAGIDLNRTRLGADIASTGSRNDLARLDSFMGATNVAEDDRQARQMAAIQEVGRYTDAVQRAISDGLAGALAGDDAAFEDWFNAEIAPALQAAGYDQQQSAQLRQDIQLALQTASAAGGGEE